MGKTGIADPFVFAAILGSEEERKDLPSVRNMHVELAERLQ